MISERALADGGWPDGDVREDAHRTSASADTTR